MWNTVCLVWLEHYLLVTVIQDFVMDVPQLPGSAQEQQEPLTCTSKHNVEMFVSIYAH